MKTLITGAAGHIGANLARLLLEQGRPVRAAVHTDERALEGLGVERAACDITNRADVERALDGVDVVYHCAAKIAIARKDERGMLRTNIEGTRLLVEAALERGVRRFVHFSSIHALAGSSGSDPVDESRSLLDFRTGPRYDASKAESERIVLDAVAHGLDAVILSPTGVIGPHDFKPSLFGDFLLLLVRGKLPSLVKGGFNWVDARDAAAGALAAEQRGRKGERYILGGEWESVEGLARLVQKVTGKNTMRNAVSLGLARLGIPFVALASAFSGRRRLYTSDSLRALSSYRLVSSRKAEEELGYTHRSLEETLADTIAWFERHGYLS